MNPEDTKDTNYRAEVQLFIDEMISRGVIEPPKRQRKLYINETDLRKELLNWLEDYRKEHRISIEEIVDEITDEIIDQTDLDYHDD